MVVDRVGGSRSPKSLAFLAVIGISVVALSCAHQGLEPLSGPVAAAAHETTVAGRQALLRVRYRGLDGRGRVRLTVRVSDGGFQLAAADAFGRQLWTFAGSAVGSQLLDHRRRQVCQFDGEVAVPAIALSDLPVSMLPAVLLRELPFTPDPTSGPGSVDRIDERGRRWTATVGEDGMPGKWTLWGGDRPLVWWQATEEGAILSHRDGAQVLWVIVADEPLDGPLPAVAVPDGYAPGDCDAQGLS